MKYIVENAELKITQIDKETIGITIINMGIEGLEPNYQLAIGETLTIMLPPIVQEDKRLKLYREIEGFVQ